MRFHFSDPSVVLLAVAALIAQVAWGDIQRLLYLKSVACWNSPLYMGLGVFAGGSIALTIAAAGRNLLSRQVSGFRWLIPDPAVFHPVIGGACVAQWRCNGPNFKALDMKPLGCIRSGFTCSFWSYCCRWC